MLSSKEKNKHKVLIILVPDSHLKIGLPLLSGRDGDRGSSTDQWVRD